MTHHDKKSQLITRKMEIQTRLTEILSKIRCGGRLPHNLYASLCNEQVKLKSELNNIEQQIAAINAELRKECELKWTPEQKQERALKRDLNKTGQVIQKLNEVREIYQAFAEDNTRISSMRLMASEFVGHLNRVIRSTINDPNGID